MMGWENGNRLGLRTLGDIRVRNCAGTRSETKGGDPEERRGAQTASAEELVGGLLLPLFLSVKWSFIFNGGTLGWR